MAVVVTVAKGYDLGLRLEEPGPGRRRAEHRRLLHQRRPGRGTAGPVVGPGSASARLLARAGGRSASPMTRSTSSVDPRTGDKLGRPRGSYAKFADHLARLQAAEPHATAERLIELEREAAQATRQPAAYTDVTVSFSKSISVLHASIRENARRARLAGDERAAAYWAGREEKFQEVLHRANRAALEYAADVGRGDPDRLSRHPGRRAGAGPVRGSRA